MPDVAANDDPTPERVEMRRLMLATYGPVLKGPELVRALGFDNAAALRQAKRQNRIGVTVFTAPGRKGMCAYTCDIADWIHDLRAEVTGGPP